MCKGEGWAEKMKSSKLKEFQKSLRTNQTDAEQKLWYHLRNRNFLNYKFRRQHIIQGYIVDFVCIQCKLVVELDGSQHLDQQIYDEVRTHKLREEGFRVLRFWNNDVLLNINGVLETILNSLHSQV
jgi:very-short-patch-repair endonuclease